MSIDYSETVNYNNFFRAIGFFNEADTPESSSILIYYFLKQSNLYAARWREPIIIKKIH
jgi:hypothetical protein